MSALAKWLTRWQPIAIHSAVLAGARMESIAGALGNSLQVAFDHWHEWAVRQRDFVFIGKPGITQEEYEAVARRFAAVANQALTQPQTRESAGSSLYDCGHLPFRPRHGKNG